MAVTVDHGLRPELAAEAAQVEGLARRLGVAHRTMRWMGPKPRTGLQEAARDARYRLLAEAARHSRSGHILTAHTRDDQAETVLFRLARGSGPAGLSGMARTSAVHGLALVRPLIDLPKARLIATLQAAQIPFVDDPSNSDPRFTRTRLRALMPALAAEGLDAARLALLARRLARVDSALETAAADAAAALMVGPGDASGAMRIAAADFATLPAEVALRLLRRAIARMGDEGPVELGKLEALIEALALARNAKEQRFRRTLAGAVVTLAAGKLTIERAPPRRAGRSQTPAAPRSAPGRAKGPFTKSP